MTGAAQPAGRVRLSRRLIVREAVSAIEEEGLTALTMRSLGRRLGVEAMALCRYVNGREDLIEAVVDELVDRIRVDPGGRAVRLDGWQAVLQLLAHSVRTSAVEHPKAFPLMATGHPTAPWWRRGAVAR